MGRQDPRDSDEQRVVENSIRLVASRMYLVVEREQGMKPVSIRRGQELQPGLEIHDKKVMVAPPGCWQGDISLAAMGGP